MSALLSCGLMLLSVKIRLEWLVKVIFEHLYIFLGFFCGLLLEMRRGGNIPIS